MKPMTSAEVRQAFLDFYEEMHHRVVPSSSLVPGNDPTLLFTNAGMVQFKDVFLGLDKRSYSRATTSQKCMRVSGKHNDLEEVGPSPRHHTFFEMLGNFSFGDYFKRDAIRFAFDLLTKVYRLPVDRLGFTVYRDDEEAYDIWVNDIGVDPRRVARLGPKTNFWQMAETGPCGPTSEIHWDNRPEGGIDSIIPALQAEDDRFLELWNLVFMQYNRTRPDPQHSGQWDEPLPAPGVDTGMGLERVVSVLQSADNNYDTDLFTPIVHKTQALAGMSDAERDANIISFRVIADHIRAATFMIADGVLPGAMGRDYVCRMVLRRAIRFGTRLGFQQPFLADVADVVIDSMGEYYTELTEKRAAIRQTITLEERRFRRTLDRGLAELDGALEQLKAQGKDTLPGTVAFYLKATLGLPFEVIRDVSAEQGYKVDEDGFKQEQERHSLVSGGGQAMGAIDSGAVYQGLLDELRSSKALGERGVAYNPYAGPGFESRVLALISDGQRVDSAITGEKVEVVLDRTHFYVESGGQVSDTGVISGPDWQIEVEGMRQPVGGLIVHIGEVVEGTPRVGQAVTARYDDERRSAIRRNHTATHLLHAALRSRLGTHVQQRGSLVAPDRLRFDFSHPEAVTAADQDHLMLEINRAIIQNMPVSAVEKALQAARQEGAMALFGEKYGDVVRTITVQGDGSRYSYELCGGTHVNETAEIGAFVITAEGSVSAGVRRIEAVTGMEAARLILQEHRALREAAALAGSTPHTLPERIQALQEEIKASKRQAVELRRDVARGQFLQLLDSASIQQIEGVPVLAAHINDTPMETLREMTDWFRDRRPTGVIVLGSVVEGRPQLVVAVSEDLIKRGIHAGNIIREIAKVVGGGGGGRPNLAQAGGKDPDKLDDALARVPELVRAALS